MKGQRLVIALTAVNLVLVLALLSQGGSATAQDAAQTEQTVLRAEVIELVDRQGQIRAQLTVEANGEAVFRMRDAEGTIRVKLGASEGGSGLLLLDEATEPAVHVIARRAGTPERPTTTSVTLRGSDGQQRVIRP